MQYYSTLKAKLIYVFTINDAAHQGCVKIGEATLEEATDSTLAPNCKELNAAARKRIDQYTKTAGISYQLHHTELTMSIHGGVITTFNDKEVHNVLLRSGIKRHDFSTKNQGKEWFECSVETALKAIQAVKEGRAAINSSEIVPIHEVIAFRPEQQLAIDKTGVNVGDRIVYTPTGQELIVTGDRMIENNGESISLAEFTAKNMPSNSISKSGVCKGPKYFSYNGVSLYKLKDSFLKKK